MSGQCSGIAQRCREVREEVFRHLTAFTAIEISSVQTYFPVVIAFAGGLIAAVAAFMIATAGDIRIDIVKLVVAAAVLFAIAVAIVFIADRWYKRKQGKAMEIAGEARVTHLENLSHYIGMLEECCEDLRRSGCASERALYCEDLNRLRCVKCKAQELLEEDRRKLTQLY